MNAQTRHAFGEAEELELDADTSAGLENGPEWPFRLTRAGVEWRNDKGDWQ